MSGIEEFLGNLVGSVSELDYESDGFFDFYFPTGIKKDGDDGQSAEVFVYLCFTVREDEPLHYTVSPVIVHFDEDGDMGDVLDTQHSLQELLIPFSNAMKLVGRVEEKFGLEFSDFQPEKDCGIL